MNVFNIIKCIFPFLSITTTQNTLLTIFTEFTQHFHSLETYTVQILP